MLQALKFVVGAVSKKDFIPELTHFRIEEGTVRSFNGTLALCCPIPININCIPKAAPLVKAIQNCEETVTLTLTPAGKLSVRSGSFKALIECVKENSPHALPEGDFFEIDGVSILEALKAVSPFIGDDASRPWSNGVLLKGESAFATNNITLVEYWVGNTFPISCNIPRAAVNEMLRINEPPIAAQATQNSITFHYTGDRWLRTQLFSLEWPDLGKVLDFDSNQQPIDEKLFAALDKIKPFLGKLEQVFFRDSAVRTHTEFTEGASFEIDNFNYDGIYSHSMLCLLKDRALTIDFTMYPKPCMFAGEKLRGAIVGMRPL